MIKSVSLTNYRNLTLTAELDSHANVIVAANGRGKSNFLESIYILNSGRSFRPLESISQIIGLEEQFASAEVEVEDNLLRCTISDVDKLQRKYALNGKNTTLSNLSKRIPVVVFAPHAVDLVAGDPAMRRKDLDDFLSTLYPTYRKELKRYTKLLKNRNALLKHMRQFPEDAEAKSTMDYWTTELASAAKAIVQLRFQFLQDIEPNIEKVSSEIYHYEENKLLLKYVSKHGSDSESYYSHLLSKLQSRQDIEVASGKTLYGPHKDDYVLEFNGQNLRYLGSRGQQRLAVFTWKYAQVEFAKQAIEKSPIFLIDDLMSELDRDHQKLVSEYLLGKKELQFVLTSAVETDLPKGMQKQNTIQLPQ